MKKKSKIIYEEEIYPSRLDVASGDLWVDCPWRRKKASKGVKFTRINMPVMVFAWWSPDRRIVAMGHQSLQ